MPIIPQRSTAGSEFAAQWNRSRESLRSHEPAQSAGMLTSHSPHGVIREPELPASSYAAPQPARAGMLFRGEWSGSATYAVQDVVIIRSGTNQGAYVCVTANPEETDPPTTPDTGNAYWVKLPGQGSVGTWV